MGSFAFDEILTHNHSYTGGDSDPIHAENLTLHDYGATNPVTFYTDPHGGSESRPFNSAVNFVIKY